MKRYHIYVDWNRDLQFEEEKYGEYIKYEDVRELLNWLNDRVDGWKSMTAFDGDYSYDIGLEKGYENCADEVEQKLREIGEYND